ncbi:hypothetical protein YB2330_006390 [Saitoella coloradoensis]
MSTKIFLLGATGYVGGSILAQLLQNKDYTFTALVRDQSRADKLKSELGVEPVIGSFEDLEVLKKAAEESDIVINAWSDDLPATKALVEGLKKRGGKGGKPAYLIQVSGTGVLCDHVKGESDEQEPFDDYDIKRIRSLPDEQIHKDVDDYLFSQNDQPDVLRTIITCPPLIYGKGMGIFNVRSKQIPVITQATLATRKNGTVGKGLNKWGTVHVEDLVKFYDLLVRAAIDGKASYGDEGFYFADSGEEYLKDMAQHVFDAVVKKAGWALVDTVPVQTPLTDSEVEKYYGGAFGYWIFAGNSRSRANRARKELGWKPEAPGLWETLDEEVEYWVEKLKNDEAKVEPGVDA